jgi:hypothetical protein
MLFLLCLIFHPLFSQWDKIEKRTNFVYSSYSVKLKYNENNNSYDTLWKKRKSNIRIIIDTVIKLSGTNRKLIFFPTCIDTIFVGERQTIVYGKTGNLPKDKYGAIDYSKFSTLKEKYKSSIVYQFGTETYILTVPKDFYIRLLANSKNLNVFDEALSNLKNCQDCLIPVITDMFVCVEEINIPIRLFVEFRTSIHHNSNHEDSDPVADFSTGRGFFLYDFSTNSCSCNKMMTEKKVNCFTTNDAWSEKRSLCIDKSFGIVRSFYRISSDNPKIAEGEINSLIEVK